MQIPQKLFMRLGCLHLSLISLFYSLFSSNQIIELMLSPHSKNPIADLRCDTQTFHRQSYLSSDIRITHAGVHVEVRTPTNTMHGKKSHYHNQHTIQEQ